MKKRITWISSDSPAEEQEEFYKRMQKSQSQANKKTKIKKTFSKISNIILWICAVGGFAVSIISLLLQLSSQQ